MAEKRRRILLVTRNMPPLIGGMERLNWHMAQELSGFDDVRVVAPEGSAHLAPAGVQTMEVPLRPLWKFLALASWRSLREARSWRPDAVLAGSGLTALPALAAARAVGARAAVYVHGLDLTVPHAVYQRLWLPAIRRMDGVIANSRATVQLAEQAGVDAARIGIVHPGVQLPEQLPDAAAVARFRAEHGLGDRTLLLSVGRLSARKGLREFVSYALPRIAAARPDVMLVVIGNTPGDALHAQAQTPESILEEARSVGLEENVRFLGPITDYRLLGVAYRAAAVHVFPVREIPGDPEGFGMVAVEAAAHGLPTVAFSTGGVVDAVENGASGCLIDSNDYAAFAGAVVATFAHRDNLHASCIEFASRFAWPEFGARLRRQLWHRVAYGQ